MTAPTTWPFPDRPGVRLDECPPGLFMFDGTLCFRSEYTTTLENPRRYQPDAYVVKSGEYFWGGAKTSEERSALIVFPVDEIHTPQEIAALVAAGQEAIRQACAARCERIEKAARNQGGSDYLEGRADGAQACAIHIADISLPAAPAALARIEAAAEARGMERAAAWHDEQATDEWKCADRWAQGSTERDWHVSNARRHEGCAAAIRAAAGEGKP